MDVLILIFVFLEELYYTWSS